MFWKRMKRYKTKKNVQPLKPKKNKKKDMRQYSSIFLLIGLNVVLWSFYYAFAYKTIHYKYASNVTTYTAQAIDPNAQENEAEEDPVLSIDPEQIENIVNTEAFTHAVWPGYRGDVSNGPEVRKHFAENLAKVIVNTGGVEVPGTYRVHFYYVVRDDGAIQFLSLVGDGRTTPSTPQYLIRHAQKLVNIGVPGIRPGTDVNGDPITVVYELVIKFTQSY